jgi:hypothetical protein
MHLKYITLIIFVLFGWVLEKYVSQDNTFAFITQIFVHRSLPLERFLHTSCSKEREKEPQGKTKDPPKEERRSFLLIPILYDVFHWSFHLVNISSLLTFHCFSFNPMLLVFMFLFVYLPNIDDMCLWTKSHILIVV